MSEAKQLHSSRVVLVPEKYRRFLGSDTMQVSDYEQWSMERRKLARNWSCQQWSRHDTALWQSLGIRGKAPGSRAKPRNLRQSLRTWGKA